jgi:NADP-dependent 3-hydroxy acid dehydrogenase YdfG
LLVCLSLYVADLFSKNCIFIFIHLFQIDILVNNAGRSQRAQWERTSLAVDREMLEVNVLGVLSLTKAVLPHMWDRRRGHVVVTSSVAGKLGNHVVWWEN